ncbi:LCP family protein required for cell wall assembly [Paenibacillus sp. V4I3]|uniref:LCP family protein n=1 Tax=Paenibacillus sp. V4I3 TaxID=3042305 RepID=UPI002780DE54|nr:LCP family protein [Paenibacillus sp. V4I3]MDQ0873190.1 LCP family protein required for cell wall assembly [Paenibacillus sp. V4I3]
MKRWGVYTAGFTFFAFVGLGGFLYWKYEPNRHFQQMDVPVLSQPVGTVIVETETPVTPVHALEKAPEKAQSAPEQTKSIKTFNLLILGIDAREDESSRSDVMMVMHIVPSERKVNILTIPRDTRVNIEGVGYTKINHAHIIGESKGGNEEGTKMALQTVSNFLDVPINYYMKTNFKGFESFIDTVGGVDVEIANDIYLFHAKKTLTKGIQHIDGKLALSLARERYAFADGDFGRQSEQSQILKNVAQELLKPEHIGDIANLLMKVKKDILDTNFKDEDLISMAWLFKGLKADDFRTGQIPGHSETLMDPLVKMPLYYWIPDTVMVRELSETFLKDKGGN